MKELLQACSEAAGCEETVAEAVINQFLNEIVQELSEGHTVDLGPDFGVFSVKLRTGEVQNGSPRTPKNAHYKAVFRENKGMARRLKVPFDRQKKGSIDS